MTAGADPIWVMTIVDPASGGRLTEIAVRAPRASAAVRISGMPVTGDRLL